MKEGDRVMKEIRYRVVVVVVVVVRGKRKEVPIEPHVLRKKVAADFCAVVLTTP